MLLLAGKNPQSTLAYSVVKVPRHRVAVPGASAEASRWLRELRPDWARLMRPARGSKPAFACVISGTRTTRRRSGGAGGTRTPDLRLAKAALSRLSYGPTVEALSVRETSTHRSEGWWAILDSNQGPQSYQDCALTT